MDNPGKKELRLRTETGKQVLIYLPVNIHDRIPFDNSDKCFVIENQ